jgi:glycosyltransferase involved in cell wall biosynthesis
VNFLWLSWKDMSHPDAGGAEVVLSELCRRLVADGHHVTVLTALHNEADSREQRDGIEYIRVGGNRYVHSFRALGYYLRHLRGHHDVVVEVVNTAPYFSTLFGGRAKRLLFYHQLARDVWFHETPPVLSHLGYYALEPIATRLQALGRTPAIAMSPSTKRDLHRFGFADDRVHIISEGIPMAPAKDIRGLQKFERPTMLSVGTMRSMKRTLDQIAAFEIAKKRLPHLQLKIAGQASGAYGEVVMQAIKDSPYRDDIEYLGRVTPAQKQELMQKAHVITVTSIKEGWGLIVSEAASQGTPAVVYDVDGLRDSVRHNQTGLVVPTDPQALADGIIALLTDANRYEAMRQAAWQWSQELTFDKSYADFMRVVEAV